MTALVAAQMLFRIRATGEEVTLRDLLFVPMAYWYGWGLLTPVIFAVSRRFAPRRVGWPTALGTQGVFALGICLLMLAWYAVVTHHIGEDERSIGELFSVYLSFGFHYDVLTYVAILGVGHALDYRRLFEQRSREALELENELVQAQLQVLRMQLRPHFLFNTLHAIASLTTEDAALWSVRKILN